MSRKPIYQKDDQKLRIISVPNGMWQAQKHVGRSLNDHTDRVSGWIDLGKARSQADAMAQINILAKATRAA